MPVMPLIQIFAKHINNNPRLTMRNTGILSFRNSSPCPNKLKKYSGKIFIMAIKKLQKAKPQKHIFHIKGIINSGFFCPTILLTIVLQVLANDHTKMPATPKTFLTVLLIAFASAPLSSIRIKKISQVVTLIIY